MQYLYAVRTCSNGYEFRFRKISKNWSTNRLMEEAWKKLS